MNKAVLESYKQAKTVLLTVSPFMASLLNKARVVVTEAVPTAAVDDKNNIVINPGFFRQLAPEERVFVLAHEVMHWAFLDPRRVQTRDRQLWNIVADAVNNEILLGIFNPGKLKKGMITMETIKNLLGMLGVDVPNNLKSMTKEELYDLLEQHAPQTIEAGNGSYNKGEEEGQNGEVSGQGNNGPLDSAGQDDPLHGDLRQGDSSSGGEVLQQGSPDIYNARDGRELEDAMKRAIAEAEQVQKTRGTMPAGLQRMVDSILRPKVPWKVLLKQALKDGLGKTRTESWKKLSRRHKDYPGHRRLTTPTVWVGIDTSGSIGEEELKQFLGEVVGIARASRAKVVVIPWDAQMYDPIKLNSPSQISTVVEGLHGGGGTDPTEFLEYTARHMKSLDVVVILSDGYIGRPEGYVEQANAIRRKASVAVFVSTGAEVRWPSWKFFKLEHHS